MLPGTCNGCGVCCHSDAWIYSEKGIADWLRLHGFDRPNGVERLMNVMVEILDDNTIKIVMLEKCVNTVTVIEEGTGRHKTLCGDHENRPEKCRAFPERPEQIRYIPNCSFHLGLAGIPIVEEKK